MRKVLGSIAIAVLLTAGPAAAVDYIRLSPSEFAQDLQRASMLAHEGRYEEAITLLRVLVDDEPDDADALALLGYSLRKSGQTARAEGFYLRALEIEPHHSGANQYLGELYVELGNLPAARARLAMLDATCASPCAGRDQLAAAIAAAD